MKNPSSGILLSLGANKGNREDVLARAIELLTERKAIFNAVVSSVYETEPVGYIEQPSFLNVVVAADTLLLPAKLLAVCKETEVALGREERPRWHEREIDIDIVLYYNKVIVQDDLLVPHPRMHERRFVLIPAAEVAPLCVHPLLHKSVEHMLRDCKDAARVENVGTLEFFSEEVEL